MPTTNWQQRRRDMDRNLELQMMQTEMATQKYEQLKLEGQMCERETKLVYANIVSTLSKIPDGEHFVQLITTSQLGINCQKAIVLVKEDILIGLRDEKGNMLQTEKLPITFGKAKHVYTSDVSGKKMPFLTEVFFIYE